MKFCSIFTKLFWLRKGFKIMRIIIHHFNFSLTFCSRCSHYNRHFFRSRATASIRHRCCGQSRWNGHPAESYTQRVPAASRWTNTQLNATSHCACEVLSRTLWQSRSTKLQKLFYTTGKQNWWKHYGLAANGMSSNLSSLFWIFLNQQTFRHF